MATKNINDNTADLANKSIGELQALFAETQRLLKDKQQSIREDAVQRIKQIAEEAGVKIFIRIPKQRDESKAKLYRNPDNADQTYNGKGAMPKWLKDKVAAGANKDDFLEKADPAAS
ncbi:H-NS histone family protein [Methylomonas sp. LL1]|uniref:H-NS histone family protein n=1 Tax=Methylomonas sp. LL1 TaxID=2785785 RepID=UPI0018C35D21|nr:H-NS histone family protein [Methylomonas sp. LL1]QPK62918.1 H-NS histone family protein [Methylomonas sp. LL1]